MYEIQVEDHFAAAHYLRRYRGKCENLHGHNYRVQVLLRSEGLDEADLGLDFTIAKKWLGQILELLDHKCLNDLPMFKKENPSAEKIAQYIYREFRSLLPSTVSMSKVSVWETEKNAVSYWE